MYFTSLPTILYDVSGENPAKPILVKNVLARARMRDMIKSNSLVFYTYNIKETDTPETIADKYYNDSNLHWIVLYANDIVDPQYDWPMTYKVFEKYLTNKYGSVKTAQTTYHHYNEVITKINSSGVSTVNKYQITKAAYDDMPETSYPPAITVGDSSVTVIITKEAVSNYQYELELNESKRNIKIIDKKYSGMIEKELNSIFR